jgi:hypothetical protein
MLAWGSQGKAESRIKTRIAKMLTNSESLKKFSFISKLSHYLNIEFFLP